MTSSFKALAMASKARCGADGEDRACAAWAVDSLWWGPAGEGRAKTATTEVPTPVRLARMAASGRRTTRHRDAVSGGTALAGLAGGGAVGPRGWWIRRGVSHLGRFRSVPIVVESQGSRASPGAGRL
jgi:hypothetical protein